MPAELRELGSRGTVMAAEKRLKQSTLSFVVNSASRSSSSRPPEDNSVSMVLGRHEDRPTNMDQEAAHEEPTSLLEVAIGWTRVLTEGEKYELLTTSQESRLSDDHFDVQLYKIDGGKKQNGRSFSGIGYVDTVG